MDMYLNLIPDLRNIVTGYFGDVIFLQGDKVGFPRGNEVTFATAEEFRKSQATDCIFINFEITSTDHQAHPDIPKTLLRCSGIPKIKTHTLAWMFCNSQFNGDISQWDVSNVANMCCMFWTSQFNGDLSKWDVSSVLDTHYMFYDSPFNNSSLRKWNVSSMEDMTCMFAMTLFNGDLSEWKVSSTAKVHHMFESSKIKKERFNRGIISKIII
jgi:surface protein